MKKNIIKYILPLVMGVMIMSCFPEDELTVKGSQVEFKNHTRELGTSLLNARGIATTAGSQTDSTRTVLEVTRVRDTIYVQLVGAQRSTATTVGFSVRASSTAVHGVNYTFNASNNYNAASSTGEVVIAPNTSIGYLILDMIDSQAAAATVRVDIDLVGGGDDLKAMSNYDVFKVTIRGQ